MPAIMTMLADHAARQLLDFNQKLDINLLDNVVNCLYHGEGAQQRMAQEVLTHLKEHPDAWTRVDTILEFSQNMNTKEEKGCLPVQLTQLGFDGRPPQVFFSVPQRLERWHWFASPGSAHETSGSFWVTEGSMWGM
uniref:Exportin 1 n=1 Tax=Gallus gallus TaxID=9031 RepID=A0A8V0ZB05_CHICK